MTALLRPPPDRRVAALVLTAVVHALLLFGWRAARQLPALPSTPEPGRIQWIDLRPRAPVLPRTPPRVVPPPVPQTLPHNLPPERVPGRAHRLERPPAPARAEPPAPPTAPAAPAATLYPAAPAPSGSTAERAPAAPAPDAAELLRRARREVGAVDRALRKENNPYIVAPPDSPELRMRRGMEAAHDAVPPKLWEAPQVEELVNNTGDGARRTRIVTGNGTLCETDRAPTTSIDMIEKHGKRRFTNCSDNEAPAKPQEWRTARDP